MQSSRFADPAPEPAETPLQPEATEPIPAPTYIPPPLEETPYSGLDGSIDEFAQTRAPDDLFDDDFTPIAQPVVETAPSPSPRGRDGPRGGRARGTARRGGRTSPPQPNDATAPADAEAAKLTPHRESAVRGDRSGTGGIKKAKLTEEELTARLNEMSLKNATLTAAHARAEADLASFEAREAQASAAAAARQKQDRQNRQQMMGERERNRQRKLKAQEGREWDAEKEEGFGGTGEERRGGARRGAYAGVARPMQDGLAGSRYGQQAAAEHFDQGDTPSFRGGGDRGRGRGRGGGVRGRSRDGDRPVRQGQAPAKQTTPTASDFPELPAAAAKDNSAQDVKAPATLDFPIKRAAATKVGGSAELSVKGAATATATKSPPPADSSAAKNPPPTATMAKKNAPRPPPTKQPSFGLTSPGGEKKSWADQVESAAV